MLLFRALLYSHNHTVLDLGCSQPALLFFPSFKMSVMPTLPPGAHQPWGRQVVQHPLLKPLKNKPKCNLLQISQL